MANPEMCYCVRVDKPETEGNIWTSINFVLSLRKLKWEIDVAWCEGDETCVFTSNEMLPEDYGSPMTIIGSDMVALYPYIEVTREAKIMKEAVVSSKIEFDKVDLLELSRTGLKRNVELVRYEEFCHGEGRTRVPGLELKGQVHVEKHIATQNNGYSQMLRWKNGKLKS